MTLLSVNGISKSFGERLLFEAVSFDVRENDRIGLIGVNGCGKTTLLRMLSGAEQPDGGTIAMPRTTQIGVMEQMMDHLGETLYQSTLSAFSPLLGMEEELESIRGRIERRDGDAESLVRRQALLNEQYLARGGMTYRSRTRAALLGLGFSEDEFQKPLRVLSGGQRNKAQLARVLLSNANLLLLDEPTNHLDIQSVAWLESFLSDYAGALIAVSHDRYFLDRVAQRTIELKNGRASVTGGNYSRHVELKSTQDELARRHYLRTQKEIRRIEGIVEQQRRFARERNFITAESKLKQIERLKKELVAPEKEAEGIRFSFDTAETGGNDVLIAKGLSKRYGKQQLFRDLEINIRRGERVFLLGPNGCGKTTLLKIMMGRESPDAGIAYTGAKVEAGFYEQTMHGLNPASTALEEIRNAYPMRTDADLRNALAAFLFRGDDVKKPLRIASGGEKARVQLLKLMLSKANFLLLDEPTNHLDIASCEALENALSDYPGTILAVTHDRYLVNKLADRVLYMADGGLIECIGGYDELMETLSAKRKEDEQADRETPPAQNAYRAAKERQSTINRARGEVRRAEERIEKAEQELQDTQAKLVEEDTLADYKKAMELSVRIDRMKIQIDALYDEWAQKREALEKLEENE